MIKAVLFDLDDTLFDHQHSRRCGLRAIQAAYPGLGPVPLEALEKEHERLLLASYFQTLDGALAIEDAMVERIRRLCGRYGLALDPPAARRATGLYREAYAKGRKPVPGAKNLLRELKARRTTVGIVSNGLRELQREKIAVCGIGEYVDITVISEEAGARKPDPAIFLKALEKAAATPGEAVYIGDSWDADIGGASACGIKAVWLNRYGLSPSGKGMATEISSYEPLENIIHIIFD